ncbi:ATP-binding protein [Frankia sp. R82]|uniref:ATP-binding protein n=1 Tax=Frankia sp. R82 TaxID=2950553 RepID=UPI002044C617|nr:ATP-binding protein [Frankia sp. R82]MCM3884334.1 histidine kinase [Frankia sp. R82]
MRPSRPSASLTCAVTGRLPDAAGDRSASQGSTGGASGPGRHRHPNHGGDDRGGEDPRGDDHGGTGRGDGVGGAVGMTETAFGAATLELGRASAEVGRAHRALDRVMTSVLVALRAVALVLTVFYLVAWDWYRDHPVAAGVLCLTAVWHVVFCLVGLRRGVGPVLAAVGAAIALPLGVAAGSLLPDQSIGDSGNFVFLAVVNASVAAVWAFPRRVAGATLLLLAAGVLIGGWGHSPQVFTQTLLLLAAPGLLGMSIGRLRQIARTADRRWANVVARHRAEAIVFAVARDRRERERVIHDTVLNTLTGLAWGGGRDAALARRRCAHSLAAVQDLLDPAADAGPALAERLAEVVAEATGRGLVVDVVDRLHPAAAAEVDGGAGGQTWNEPPGVVGSAFAGAVREALANIERHSGSSHAWVVLDGGPDEITVQVRDIGRGFEPDLADSGRLGLRRSVIGRIEDVAGTADITSAPGRGTTVELRWRTPRIVPTADGVPSARVAWPAGIKTALGRWPGAAGGSAATGGPDAAGGRHDGLVPDRRNVAAIAADLGAAYSAGLRRAVGHVAAAWLMLMLAPLLDTLHWVREPLVAVVLWVALAVVVATAGRLVRRRPLSGREVLLLLAIAAGTVVVGARNTVGADIVRIADWPLLMLALLLAFVTASRPAREWTAALAGAVVLVTGLVLARDGGNPLVVARLGSIIYGCCAVQIITAMLGPLLRRTGLDTAHILAAEAEVAANADSSAMIRRERLAWLGTVERDVLPLLADVADGRRDPATAGVRSASAARAAGIRRMLTGGGPSSALADLDPVLADAESAGISVEIQRSGDLRTAPGPVRAALADRVGEVLATAGSGRAIVTVMWSPAGGSVYVTMPWPDELALPDAVLGTAATAPIPTSDDAPLRAADTSARAADAATREGDATARVGDEALRVGVEAEVDDHWLSLELTWPCVPPDGGAAAGRTPRRLTSDPGPGA